MSIGFGRGVCIIALCFSVPFGGCQAALPPAYSREMRGTLALAAAAAPGSAAPAAAPGPGMALPGGQTVSPAAPQPMAAGRVCARPARIMIYSASLQLIVADLRGTLEVIRRSAEATGGYLQELTDDTITVRVPADRFDQALAGIERLGQVVQRQVKAQDMTEEMRDLRIRLANAQEVRQRLIQLVDKSQKMEDTLKIEAELERVTQTIELLKGKIQFLESEVAYSTIGVRLNSPLAQQQVVEHIPFEWVRRLGDGLVTGAAAAEPDTNWAKRLGQGFELPKSYIRYFDRDGVTEAMSAEGMLIKLQRQSNFEGGDMEFWAKLARRALMENRAVVVSEESDLELPDKTTARLIVGGKDAGGKPQGYLLGLIVSKGHVQAFEAWGPREAFARDLPQLKRAIATVKPVR